jgi:hypothetical protein
MDEIKPRATDTSIVVSGTPVKVEEPRKLRGVHFPKAETVVHRAMYAHYLKLGKTRSLSRVAKEFGKSVAFISTLSRCFRWAERIREQEQAITDPVVAGTLGPVDASRVRLVEVVNDVVETLHELMQVSKKIKASDAEFDGSPEQTRAVILLKALRVFGIEIAKPKDLRDLISVLKDIVEFKAGAIPTPQGKTDINIEKVLIVRDLE